MNNNSIFIEFTKISDAEIFCCLNAIDLISPSVSFISSSSFSLNINTEYTNMVLYAEDIMRKNCQIVDGSISAFEGSRIMAEKQQGFVIIGKENVPEGIVTEWDFINKILSKKIDPSKITLKEIMTSPLTSVPSDTPMEKIANLMAGKGIRRLIVVDNNKLSGIITSRDILKFFSEYVSDMVEIASKFGIR
ncbi:CBS domain-containing protein [Ferroplasma sp.]|uniref:CBS domain-containing protein n=1 Tax=Ferroplasma sp. TaxID=2591003 RepID=UPI00307E762B